MVGAFVFINLVGSQYQLLGWHYGSSNDKTRSIGFRCT